MPKRSRQSAKAITAIPMKRAMKGAIDTLATESGTTGAATVGEGRTRHPGLGTGREITLLGSQGVHLGQENAAIDAGSPVSRMSAPFSDRRIRSSRSGVNRGFCHVNGSGGLPSTSPVNRAEQWLSMICDSDRDDSDRRWRTIRPAIRS